MQNLSELAPLISDYVNQFFLLIVGIAILTLAWHSFRFIISAGNEAERTKSRTYILWAVMGVFLIISVWGVVNLVSNTIGLDTSMDNVFVPQITN